MKTNEYGMFEEKGRENRRRKTGLRILSTGLSLSLLFTGCGSMYVTPFAIAGMGRVEAAESKDAAAGSTNTVITGFSSLAQEVREQTVPLGTTIEELNLPDTLEACVAEKGVESEGGGVNPSEDSEEDKGGKDQDDNKGPGDSDHNKDDEETHGEPDKGGGTDSGSDGGETSGGNGDGEASGGDENSGNNNSPDDDNGGEEIPDSREKGGEETPANDNDNGSEGKSGDENGIAMSADGAGSVSSDTADSRETVGFSIETGSFVIPVYASENPQGDLTVGTLTDTAPADQADAVDAADKESAKTGTTGTQAGTDGEAGTTDVQADTRDKIVKIENVTWQSNPAYDRDTEGTYLFTPVLPEGYVLAGGVGLPEMKVTVADDTDAIIQALLERIALLPDAQEYLEKEPDIDNWVEEEDAYEEAYDKWMKGLNAYAEEALAIWEKYEALTGEQQERMPEEEMAKLAAWLKIAEKLAESRGVLATDGTAAPGTIASDQEWSAQTLAAGTYTINPGVTVTLKGIITINGAVTIQGGGKMVRGDAAAYFTVTGSGSHLTLRNIEADGALLSSSNPLISASSGAQVTLGDGCRIHRCIKNSSRGAALNLDSASAVFENTVIENCQATSYGGAVYMGSGSSLIIRAGTYRNNSTTGSSQYGGGFIYNSSSTLKIYGGSYIGNTSTGKAGCIYNTGKTGTETYLYGGYFQGNRSSYSNYVGSGSVLYSSENTADTVISISGSVQFCGNGVDGSGVDGVFLDISGTTIRKAKISSELQYLLPLYLTAEEGRVIAEGVGGYQLQKRDMKKIIFTDVGTSGTVWYAKLDETNNQVILTTTNPGYSLYVTYAANGGEGNISDSREYTSGDTVTVQPGTALHRDGYTFNGWNTRPDGTGTSYPAGASFQITEDVTLYAQWTAMATATTYTVTYNKNGGTIANEYNYTKYTYGTGLTLPTPTNTGYTFGGWYENAGCTGSQVTDISTTATGNKIYYAKWTADAYKVTFDYQGATGGNSTTEKTVTYDSTYASLPSPTRTGYTFKGWFTQTGGQGDQIKDTTVVKITSARTLYAYWKDETKPDKPVLQNSVTLPTDWTKTQTTIPLTLYDGVGVTELLVSIDGGAYTKVNGFSGGSQTVTYSHTVSEGNHTYRFMAKDAAGNESPESDAFQVKLDITAPVVTFALPQTPRPNAGGWYSETFDITVTAADDKQNGSTGIISGGIARIIWKDGENGAEQTVSGLPGTLPVYSKTFTISVSADGTHNYYVKAADNAGNESGWKTVTVKLDRGSPVFSGNPTVKNVAPNSADITFTPSEGGKAYWIVDPAETPDSAQAVVEGAQGSAYKGGVKEITGGSSADIAITGLTPGKAHKVYLVLEDAAGNLSEVKKIDFSTFYDALAIRKTVQDTLAGITVSNETTEEDIRNAVEAALEDAGITDMTVTIEDFTKTNATTSAEGSITGSITVTSKNDDSVNESVPIGKTILAIGTVTPEVKPGDNAPETSISTPTAELEKMLLTEAEKELVKKGINIKIILEVKDAESTVSDSDRASVKQALNGFTVGQYLNIDLYKLVGEKRTDITETTEKITIAIAVPDSLKIMSGRRTRTFSIIRVHNGRGELLPDLDSDADTITIETDRFSTYAIVYKDTANGGSGGGNGGGNSGSGNGGDSNGNGNGSGDNGNGGNGGSADQNSFNNNGSGSNNGAGNNNGGSSKISSRNSSEKMTVKQGSAKDDEPETGDNTPVELCATLSMIAGFAYLLLYFTDREKGMTEETKKELVSRLAAWAKQGGRIRRWLALAAIFVLLVYYHSIGKKTETVQNSTLHLLQSP